MPNCPSWVTLGDVDPTYEIPSLSVSRLTPGALALLVRDTLRNVDVGCEVRLRRNGTSGYELDLVTQIGADSVTPTFHPNNGLLTLKETADPTLQATRVLIKGGAAPDGFPGVWGRARWRGGAPVGNVIALTDRNGAVGPIGFDGQFVGAFLLRVKTGRTFLITASDAAAGTVTLESVSTIGADEDFEVRRTEPLSNSRGAATRYAISAVPDGTHITCAVSAPITANDQFVDWYAQIWSASSGGTIIATTRITGSVAATDVIAVASSAGVTTAHYVQFIQLDGAGEIPSTVDHPLYVQADPVGYGVKVMELPRPMLGVTQCTPNAWMRVWSNPSNPPEGWSHTGNMTVSKSTDPDFTRYGGASWKFTEVSFALDTNVFTSPPTFLPWTELQSGCSCRALLYFELFSSDTFPRWVELAVYARTESGGLGASLGAVRVMPATSTDTVTIVGDGAWVELKVEIQSLAPDAALYGVVGVVRLFGGWTITGYLDLIEIYPFSSCPSEPTEFGDATALLQSANNQLRVAASPPRYYTFGVADLERAFPEEYGRLALILGGLVRAADVDYGMVPTVRLLKLERDLLDPSATRLTLANRPSLFTAQQSASAVRAQKIIAAVAAQRTATAPGFVALAADTALPVGAEITTGATGAPVVTLPTGSETTGAAVSFLPDDPSTDPITTVTVGRPPSRFKPTILF